MTETEAHNFAPGASNGPPRSTALTVIAGATDAPTRSFAITRPDPSFVAQLIATAVQAPQTRRLRRASPQDAQSSYRAALGHEALRSGRMSRVA